MKKSKTKIKVGVVNEAQANREFIDAWRRAENGKIKRPEERIYFLEAATLLKVLSNRRLGLLHLLYEHGALSIRRLSKLLHRDYHNVHDDVRLLKQTGLIQQTGKDTIGVPWDKIQAEIDLAA